MRSSLPSAEPETSEVWGSRLSFSDRGDEETRSAFDPGGKGLGESTRGNSPLLSGSCTPGKLPPLEGACTGISPLGEDARSPEGKEPLPWPATCGMLTGILVLLRLLRGT